MIYDGGTQASKQDELTTATQATQCVSHMQGDVTFEKSCSENYSKKTESRAQIKHCHDSLNEPL